MTKIEEQILGNQIVIMGLLQDLQAKLEYIPNIQQTHDLIIAERKVAKNQIPYKPYKVTNAGKSVTYCGKCDMVCGDGIYCRMCGAMIDHS